MKVPNETLIIGQDENGLSITRGEFGIIEIDENQIALCDICNIEIGTHKNIKNLYSPEKITKAIMNGLRPTKTISANIPIMMVAGMSADKAEKELYASWRELAVTSETPWAVCDECKEQIEKYLNVSKVADT